jgi:HK97 family phage major capsid protein
MTIDLNSLSSLTYESLELTRKKGEWTKRDSQKAALLSSMISAIKSGANLSDLQSRSPENQLLEARAWQSFVERRDMVEGAPMLSHIGTYSGLGYFVPTGFYPKLFAAMGAHDFLFNDEDCTVIKTDDGRPMTVPVAGDIENVATLTSEAGSRSSVDFASVAHVELGSYSFSSPRFVASQEAFQDVSQALSVVSTFRQFCADRIARGVSAYLVTGTGTGQPKGLLQSLSNLGVPVVTSAGSAVNDGSANTGANSLGSPDFANALADLDSAYLSSDKLAWGMNKRTLATLKALTDKVGRPLKLVEGKVGEETILGVPVKISPSFQNIGASNVPVVLGDYSYWVTRIVNTEKDLGITVIQEADGLVENGKIGLVAFFRADGALAYTDTSSPCPFVPIQNHS